MDLVAAHPEARLLYCEKLLADVADPIGGALARRTRIALGALATAWAGGASSTDASASFLGALADAGHPGPGNMILPAGWR
jgi:fatty acid desaturase